MLLCYFLLVVDMTEYFDPPPLPVSRAIFVAPLEFGDNGNPL